MNYIYTVFGYNQQTCSGVAPYEILDKVYEKATFFDFMTLSMCSKAMKERYEPVLEAMPDKFYEAYSKYVTRYSVYLSENRNGLSDLWNISKVAASVASTIWNYKTGKQIYAEIPLDTPKITRSYYDSEANETITSEYYDHENVEVSSSYLGLSVISGIFSAYSTYKHCTDRTSEAQVLGVSVWKQIVSPSYSSWIVEKLVSGEFYLPVTDSEGHMFDFMEINSELIKNREVIRCPQGKHIIRKADLRVCKKSFDLFRRADLVAVEGENKNDK